MSQTIRIAVPTSAEGGIDAPRSAHFGHAGSFTIVDVVEGRIESSTVVATPRAAAEAYLAGGLAPFGDDRACAGH